MKKDKIKVVACKPEEIVVGYVKVPDHIFFVEQSKRIRGIGYKQMMIQAKLWYMRNRFDKALETILDGLKINICEKKK